MNEIPEARLVEQGVWQQRWLPGEEHLFLHRTRVLLPALRWWLTTIRNSGGPMPQAPDMCNVAKTYMKAKHVYTFFKVTTCWG